MCVRVHVCVYMCACKRVHACVRVHPCMCEAPSVGEKLRSLLLGKNSVVIAATHKKENDTVFSCLSFQSPE